MLGLCGWIVERQGPSGVVWRNGHGRGRTEGGVSPNHVGSLEAFAVLTLLAAEAQPDQEKRLCSRTMAF
jgi:hypothetical protein